MGRTLEQIGEVKEANKLRKISAVIGKVLVE